MDRKEYVSCCFNCDMNIALSIIEKFLVQLSPANKKVPVTGVFLV